jgi:sulfatase maturation enzyme AslB (radical SAM superfamily)
MKITGITWITTYNCNIACEHCFFDTKGPKRYMSPDLIDNALADFTLDKHMFWHHLSGGEIFLQKEKLIEIIKRIRKYFKKDIGISTNGFWAKSETETESIVRELDKNGVSGIAVSADYYHQQHMSIEEPKTLARVIKKCGLKTHSYVMGARLNTDVVNSASVNAQSETIAKNVIQNMDIPLALPTERSIGKGSVINNPKKTDIPQGKCTELNTCLGERSPFNPAMVWIDPYGNVMICYGIIIGNLYSKTLNQIISEYKPEKYPLLKELASEGPKGVFKIAKDLGMDSSKGFYDECDLCYKSRSFLRKKLPEILGPSECYPV